MTSIINAVEANPEYKRYIKINWEKININDLNFNAIVSASASLAYRLKSPIIGVGTVTGKIARQLSSFRPSSEIVAYTHNEMISRQLLLSWGVIPIIIDDKFESHSFDKVMTESIIKNKLTRRGNTVILVWGSKIGTSGTTDTIRIVKI